MPLEEFKSLCYLPLPILDASRQYYKMCMVSYQLNETDHLCQVQKKLMEMNWIKQTINFSLQLEGSELHLPVESASSLGVSMLKLR